MPRLRAKVLLIWEYDLGPERESEAEEGIWNCAKEDEIAFCENPGDVFDAWADHDGKMSVSVKPVPST